MPADDHGRSLKGLGINVLVHEMASALSFRTGVLEADIVYFDPDFAVLKGYGAEWTLHADHTYNDHPLSGSLGPHIPRGVGVEFRLHGCDPDGAEARAIDPGYTVLAGPMDKPHGLREAYLLCHDGYLWVLDFGCQNDFRLERPRLSPHHNLEKLEVFRKGWRKMMLQNVAITELYAGILGLFVIPLNAHVIMKRYRAKLVC